MLLLLGPTQYTLISKSMIVLYAWYHVLPSISMIIDLTDQPWLEAKLNFEAVTFYADVENSKMSK